MESDAQQTSQGKAVVAVFAAVLERLVSSNSHVLNTDSITKFHALKAPAISIKQYLERIHKYASCSTECFILALIYIDRLIQRNNFILTELNVHRVCITAILLAAKFFDDAYYNNAYYAKVGGVLVSEMNGLEVEFLFRINFSLHVTPDLFIKYQDELISHALGAGLERPPELTVPLSPHAVASLVPTPTPVIVSMPVTVPVPLQHTNVEHGCHSSADWNAHAKSRNTSSVQRPWTGVVHSTVTSYPEVYQEPQGPRHITPSPPNQYHRIELIQKKISPAHSTQGDLHISRSDLSSNVTTGNLPQHIGTVGKSTRPRYSPCPSEYPSAVTCDSKVFSEQQFQSGVACHYPPIHGPTDGLPCSHYGRQIDSNSTSPHLVNATRGI